MSSETHASGIRDKVMLVGVDSKQIIEKRLQAAGCKVIKVADEETALDQVRHEVFDKAVTFITRAQRALLMESR